MSKKILFAVFTILTIFNHQYIHGGEEKRLRELENKFLKLAATREVMTALQSRIEAEIEKPEYAAAEELKAVVKDNNKKLEITEGHLAKAGTLLAIASISRRTSSAEPVAATKICDECKGTFAEIFKCGGCRQAQYCDRICQRTAWKEHKDECRKHLNPSGK